VQEATAETFETGRADAFARRMVEVLNSAVLALLCSVGRRTDLFDTMAGIGHATPAEIARVGDQQERHVQEWLGAIACGGSGRGGVGGEGPGGSRRSLRK
jgi:hypothetical protein